MTSTSTSLIQKVQNILGTNETLEKAKKHGLTIVSTSWDDTSRYKNSSLGKNISDMTLNVDGKRLPIIRPPNFSDHTFDIPIENFKLKVGNETSGVSGLKEVTLEEFLKHLETYTSLKPSGEMFQPRDKSILSSYQSCILPVEEDQTEFTVDLYNYQSKETNPRVLVIVASDHGTSACVTDTDGVKKLYFNKEGSSCNFKAQRLSDNRRERGVKVEGEMTKEEKAQNMLMIFQIPLENTYNPFLSSAGYLTRGTAPVFETPFYFQNNTSMFGSEPNMFKSTSINDGCCSDDDCLDDNPEEDCDDIIIDWDEVEAKSEKKRSRGIENAILKIGQEQGRYSYYQNKISRDKTAPIRVTFQFYNATDTSEISDEIFSEIQSKFEACSRLATARGSLVTSTSSIRDTETVGNLVKTNYSMAEPISVFGSNFT